MEVIVSCLPPCSGCRHKKDITVLRVLRGKRLMVVEQREVLSAACRAQIAAAGATVVGPVPSLRAVLRTLEAGDADAVIIDINVDVETMLQLTTLFEAMGLPFVFSSAMSANHAGYVLSDDRKQLRKIADALFGPPGASSTLH